MNITIAAATPFEIREEVYTNTLHRIQFLYTGIGVLSSAISFMQHVFQHKPDLIIQAGIAGSFDTNIKLGNVVVIEKEYLGDTGVWEGGEWKDLFDMNLQKSDEQPFTNRSLPNKQADKLNKLHLPKVTGVTINEITTSEQRMKVLTEKYKADVESMEGASLHYVCNLFSVSFIQLRAISNYVGERDKTKWEMKDSIANVNEAARKTIAAF